MTRPDFRALFEAAPEPYLVLTPDFTIVAVSDAYLRATMTERKAIVGCGLFDVFPDNPDDPSATGARNLRASLERVLESRAPDTMAVQKYDIRRPEAEGGGFEERHWSPVNAPVLGLDGQVAYIIHHVEDVTEFVRLSEHDQELGRAADELRVRTGQMEAEIRLLSEWKRAGKAAQESEQRLRAALAGAEQARVEAEAAERRYRLLFESNPNPMWVYDVETLAFLAVNATAVARYGYTREEFLGMTIADIRSPEDAAKVRAAAATAVPLETKAASQWRHRTKDGKMFDVEISSHSLVFDGRAARLVLAVDVTERRRLEEQLRQSQKLQAIGQLAGGIAHDFNNVLTVIKGCAALLLDSISPDDARREDVVEIAKAGDRAAALTGQLLAFSRKQVLQPTILDINGVVADIEKMLRRLIGENIDLTLVMDPSAGHVTADRGQLEQVLLNLVVNARDAMPNGGKLIIRTRAAELDEDYARTRPELRAGDYVELAVSDNGCGMSPDTLARVFEPFFTTKERGKGTGMGLSTAYGIVQQSGGHIFVYSEPGLGATFKVYLPRVGAAGKQVATAPLAEVTRGTETVAVVDDDPGIRSVVCKVLRANGYTVLEATAGHDAIERVKQHQGPIHLLITDVIMPAMNGRELSERVRVLRPATRVLFMSGYTDDLILHHGVLEAGIAFLNKPFTPRQLLRKVREVLDATEAQSVA